MYLMYVYTRATSKSISKDCTNLNEFKYYVDGQTIIKNSRYMKNI